MIAYFKIWGFLFVGKSSPWLSIDTALYILKENENQANLQLMCFTELRNREVYIYFLIFNFKI